MSEHNADQRPVAMHLLRTLVTGGAERLTAAICAELQARGRYRPVVVAWAAGGPTAADLEAAGVEYHVLGLPPRRWWLQPWRVCRQLLNLRRCVNLAKARGARVVHGHLSEGAVAAATIAGRLGIAGCSTEHSTQSLPADLRGFRRRLRRWSLGRAFRKLDAVVACSDEVAGIVAKEFAPPDGCLRCIPNGIPYPPVPVAADAAAAIRGELGVAPTTPLVVCVGRLVPSKNQVALIKAWPQVADAHLLLAGDGPERESLATLAREQGVADRVHLLGNRSDVPAILAAVDCFASASLFEGISLAVLEAMARRVPVVAVGSPGNELVLADGCGVLLPDDAVSPLAAAINQTLAAGPAVAEQIDAAEQRVAERFSLRRVVDELQDCYDAIAAS